jgi:two-component system OmpR family sensor kinase
VKLVTRLTILLTALTTLLVLSVGWFAVSLSSRSQYSRLDSSINSVVASGTGHPNTALSDALNVVQQQSYDLTLDVIDPSGSVTQISIATVAPTRNPTFADVRATLNSVRRVSDLPGFHLRSLNVGGGAYLVVIGSTGQIDQASRRLALDLALVGVTATAVMMLLVRLFTRRDLQTMERLITYASEVASGRDGGQIPPSLGSSDVRQLQSALSTMVAALHERISIEERSVEVMQMFIGDASHELRTPLTVIKGYNQLISSPGISEEQRVRAVERMRREIERMESLVTDLLLAAEVREAPHNFEQRVDLSLLLATRTDDFSNDNPQRMVTSTIAARQFVSGREDFLDRLLTNAFSNIARHTPADLPVRVTLSGDAQTVTMRIEDGGKGLAKYGLRPQRFGRLDASRSRETGGSGLGMSIMADIAEAMGGSLTTSRSELGGLALNFEFPANGVSRPAVAQNDGDVT